MKENQLLRALAFDKQVRIILINARKIVEEARHRHDTWYSSTAALGRTLIGSLLLAANLKGNDQLTIRIEGQGPGGSIYTNADAKGNVRGFITNPHVALPSNAKGKIDVAAVVGLPGSLTVSKYIEDLEPFSGQVNLVSGEIAEDLTYYMAVSEQTPSSIGLSVLIDTDESVMEAGGFFIQVLPGAEEETIVQLEESISQLGQLSDLFRQGINLEDLLITLVGPDNYQILSQTGVQFYCPCHKEYYAEKLVLLSENDLIEMISEGETSEIVCHYCGNKYYFSPEDLQEIYQQKLTDV